MSVLFGFTGPPDAALQAEMSRALAHRTAGPLRIDPTADTLWTDDRREAGLQETAQWVVTAYNHIRAASGIAA